MTHSIIAKVEMGKDSLQVAMDGFLVSDSMRWGVAYSCGWELAAGIKKQTPPELDFGEFVNE